MIEVTPEKRGTCATCGAWPTDARLYRIKAGGLRSTTSICLCLDCMDELTKKMRQAALEDGGEGNADSGKDGREDAGGGIYP